MLLNGEVKKVPAILIGWDQETQTVGVQFDSQQFKTFDFLIAVLDMAKGWAQDAKRQKIMATMIEQEQRAKQAKAQLDTLQNLGR